MKRASGPKTRLKDLLPEDRAEKPTTTIITIIEIQNIFVFMLFKFNTFADNRNKPIQHHGDPHQIDPYERCVLIVKMQHPPIDCVKSKNDKCQMRQYQN